jgi:methylglyoxal synthase
MSGIYKNKKTLVAVLASHDSTEKNNQLSIAFEKLYNHNADQLAKFHFVFTGGTFRRLVLAENVNDSYGNKLKPISEDVKNHLLEQCGVTVLPDRTQCGVTILANLIVQRQCSIIWPFLSPNTPHWLTPDYLALMRLCDLWYAKRLMNVASVLEWFRYEAPRDEKRNLQIVNPLILKLGSAEKSVDWPKADGIHLESGLKYYQLRLPYGNERCHGKVYELGQRTIALVAHDEMKKRIVDYAIQYEDELCNFSRILATGHTGQEVKNACRNIRENELLRSYLSGPKGGDIEIATEILFNRCHTVVFFVDPLNPHPHIDDIRVVFIACMAEIEKNDVRMLTNEVHAREWIEALRRRRV